MTLRFLVKRVTGVFSGCLRTSGPVPDATPVASRFSFAFLHYVHEPIGCRISTFRLQNRAHKHPFVWTWVKPVSKQTQILET